MGLLILRSGPLDGAKYERASRPPNFVWIDRDGRCWSTGAEGRTLYTFTAMQTRRADGAPDDGAWPRWHFDYAQLLVTQCSDCGWFVPRVERRCPMCACAIS